MNNVTHFQQDWKYAVRKLRQIAHVKGVRQKELAIATGSSDVMISQFFNCKYRPNLEFYFAVCGALGVRVAYFMDLDDATCDALGCTDNKNDSLCSTQETN